MNSSNGIDPAAAWVAARLIPAGKMRQEEQETRATSTLLAVMAAVPSFGSGLLGEMKVPRGRIATFTEVRLKDGKGKTHIPDGAIVIERGKTRWSSLVEVKTGRSNLDGSQVERYIDMAREHGFDAVLTISQDSDSTPVVVANSHRGDRAASLSGSVGSRAGMDLE